MANWLKVARVHAIRLLHQQGWSNRRIARELGIDRGTVNRYVCRAREGPNAANAPTGSGEDGRSKAANAPLGSGPASRSEPYRSIIEGKLDQGLSAQRIYQDLVVDHGFEGSYHSVRRFVRKLTAARPLPFRRMECEPGQEAQVDLGKGAPVRRTDGRRKRPHVFRIVLSYSRKGYSEAIWRQDTETFLRCLENAFWSLGGVPKTLVVDNLKAAVVKADWFDPELNPKLEAFCRHYGTVVLPTKPYTPRHKGKSEREINYVQTNGLKGHEFNGLADENSHLQWWETHVADTRIHGTTRKQVGKVFLEEERSALLALPPSRFPSFNEVQRSVHCDGHVEVAKAYYSVPPEYVGRRVWVRWDGRVVRVFNERLEQIAIHLQREAGKFSTDAKHIVSQKISGVERGAAWWLKRASRIGPDAERWAKDMLAERGIQGVRVLVGLLSLTHRHEEQAIERACRIASSHGMYRLRMIRQLIQRIGSEPRQLELTETHEIIRDLRDYGQLVHTALAASPTVEDSLWARPREEQPFTAHRSQCHENKFT
jgi:transposase